jgi:hypothetical protein
MVRREEASHSRPVSRCPSPAGASPASVSPGAPSSRPQARDESRVARAGCHKPLRRKPARGPQHQVKPAASTHLQPESRADHVAVKAMSSAPRSGGARADGLGGVGGAARVHGEGRNTRGPSARPASRQRGSYKPTAKSSRAQRESEGAVVLTIAVTNNAAGGKGPYFGRARNGGTCRGMAGKPGPTHPTAPLRAVLAQQPQPELWTGAEYRTGSGRRWGEDNHHAFRGHDSPGMHATSRRPSVSRVPEIGTHGLNGGLALTQPAGPAGYV